MVCQGRKVVYLLRIGNIHSKNCLSRETPTPSFRRDSGIQDSGWKTCVVPNGWKVAVIVDNDVWTAEIGYEAEHDTPRYQFTRLDDAGRIHSQSKWCLSPSGAFKSASVDMIVDETAWGRHNGKLYLGCTYDYPQHFLRQYFKSILESGRHQWDEFLKAAIVEWLSPNSQSPEAVYNDKHGLGPIKFAAQAAAALAGLPRDEHPVDNAPPPLKKEALEPSDPETKSAAENEAKRVRKSSATVASSVSKKKAKPLNTLATVAAAETEVMPNNQRLDAVTASWLSGVWSEIVPDMYQSEIKLRRMFPGIPVYPSQDAQSRAFNAPPSALLSEEDILAILFHVDGQVQRVTLDKQMTYNVGNSTSNRPMSISPVTGYIVTGAIKSIIDIIPGKRVEGGIVRVMLSDFLAKLDNIEAAAEYLFPMLAQTLALFSVDDIFKKLEEGKPAIAKETLSFIRKRMTTLDVDSKDKFAVFSHSAEFIRALTFLPRASLVSKFVDSLHSMSSTIAISQQPTAVLPFMQSPGPSQMVAMPTGAGMITAQPWPMMSHRPFSAPTIMMGDARYFQNSMMMNQVRPSGMFMAPMTMSSGMPPQMWLRGSSTGSVSSSGSSSSPGQPVFASPFSVSNSQSSVPTLGQHRVQ